MLNSNRPDIPQRGWFPANHEALQALLHDLYDHPSDTPRTATFDWDNTSVFHDVGDAVFRHQLDTLTLRITPQDFALLLPERIGDCTTLHGGIDLAAIGADLRAAYAALWPSMLKGQTSAVRHNAAHLDLRAKLGWLYGALEATPGVGAAYAYAWLMRFLRGFSEAEIADVAWDAWRSVAAEAIGSGHWESSSAGAAGRLRYPFIQHIAPVPEIMDLFAAFGACGVQVYVISASYEGIVRGLAGRLGYAVAPENILGMRQPETDPTYPLTYRRGKAQVIERFLPAPPLFAAGDANTDFEMLTSFSSLRTRLLIARDVQGDIRSLYPFATRPPTPEGLTTLLQGRDEQRGIFHPHQETTTR